MRYLIHHQTRIAFEAPVREHHCELRVAPIVNEQQRRLSLDIAVEPAAPLHTYTDGFGNLVHHFDVFAPHTELVTRLDATVETLLDNPFAYPPIVPARERAWLADALRTKPPLWDYVLHRSPFTPALPEAGRDWPRWPEGTPLLEAVQLAMQWVGERLEYRPGSSAVDSPLEQVLAQGRGVCQDFAHALVTVVRSWGAPARYVMGYVDAGYHDEEADETPEATHAWAEVLLPGAGWRGFDPAHQLVANDTYVAVAVGRDYRDASPQRGTFQGADEGTRPDVLVRVARQHAQQQ